MRDFRARIGVQTAVRVLTLSLLTLVLGAAAHAANTTNEIDGTQAELDGACVAPIPFFNALDCSYDASDPTGFGADGWQGPTPAAWYYLPGTSPGPDNPPAAGDGDPNKTQLPITGEIYIDDQNTLDCSDDTIAGNVSLGAGVRAFSGGQGAYGEESWGDGDIVFSWTADSVDLGQANGAGGCDYEIASDGFPDRIQEAGGTMRLYPFDANVDAEGFYLAPGTSGVASVSEGNAGLYVPVTVGGGWSCDKNDTGDACEIGDGIGFDKGGPHFKGTREAMETVLLSISTDGAGDITRGEAYVNNEAKIFNIDPDPFNSWDGTYWDFTGECANCSLAKDDTYSLLLGGPSTYVLDIGANDDDEVLIDPTTVTIDTSQPFPQGGTATINNSPGDISLITFTYTPNQALAGDPDSLPVDEVFVYTADDTANPGSENDPASATVTVTLDIDRDPVAGALNIEFSTAGVDPTQTTGQVNALETPSSPGNDGAVTDVGDAASGNTDTDGTIITYTPKTGVFHVENDTFAYEITDEVTLEAEPQVDPNGTVTVNIADVSPAADDDSEGAETEEGVSVPVDITDLLTLGNGSLAQHTFDAAANNGTCEVDVTGETVMMTYTPDTDFFGDDACTYSITDEGGAGQTDEGVVAIFVNEVDDLVKFPGGTALGPWTLVLLLGLPLLRRRRA